MCQDTGTAHRQGEEGPTGLHRRRRRGGHRPRRVRHLSHEQPALQPDGADHDVRRAQHRQQPPGRDQDRRHRRRRVQVLVHRQGRRQRQQELPVPGDQGAAQRGDGCCRGCSTRCRRSAPRPARRTTWRSSIGGTSAEYAVETAKLASTKYLDSLPTAGSTAGHAFRDVDSSARCCDLAQTTGIGAQFGGKYFCHDVRVIRLPRHGASCPVAMAVSCSADRQALGKITRDGVFLEELERDPARFLPDVTDADLDGRATTRSTVPPSSTSTSPGRWTRSAPSSPSTRCARA